MSGWYAAPDRPSDPRPPCCDASSAPLPLAERAVLPMPDLRPLLVARQHRRDRRLGRYRHPARAADPCADRPRLCRPHLSGDPQPERGAGAARLCLGRRAARGGRSRGHPGAGGACGAATLDQCGRARHPRRGRDQLGLCRGEAARPRTRATSNCAGSPSSTACSSAAPIPRGWSTRCSRSSRPSARCSTIPGAACCRRRSTAGRSRSAARAGR